VAVTAVLAAGCPSKRVPIPAPDPGTRPKATLDIVFPSGPVRTVTATTTDPALPAELVGTEQLSFSARCADEVAGCRNIQVFVTGTVSAPDGATQPLSLPALQAQNLDTAANPGGTAETQRNVTSRLDVGPLRGTSALLHLVVTARATNGFGATEDTRPVNLVWMRSAPLVMPGCPRFGPIGSPPPDLLDVRPLITGMMNAKNANPALTRFEFGVATTPGRNPSAGFDLASTEINLPPTSAIFQLIDKTGHGKSALTVNGRDCNAAGELLEAQGNGTSAEVMVNSSDVTTLVFTANNQDVVVLNEATFWLLFGGKRNIFTWVQ
jgi:hypothetical protein